MRWPTFSLFPDTKIPGVTEKSLHLQIPLLPAPPTYFQNSKYIFKKYIQLTYYSKIFITIGLQISSGLAKEQDHFILVCAP